MAFLLERDYGLTLPRRMQIEFSRVVQRVMDTHGTELSSADLWNLFEREYIGISEPLVYRSHHLAETENQGQMIAVSLDLFDRPITIHGYGNGPIAAFVEGLGLGLHVHHYEERSLTQGNDACAIAIVEMGVERVAETVHGAGIHANIVTASLVAIVSALNRAIAEYPELADELSQRLEINSSLLPRTIHHPTL
jgi:2-isopropylmalate synthase